MAEGELDFEGVIYRKDCACLNAAASGPRVVQIPASQHAAGKAGDVKLVPFACDTCQRPWRVFRHGVEELG